MKTKIFVHWWLANETFVLCHQNAIILYTFLFYYSHNSWCTKTCKTQYYQESSFASSPLSPRGLKRQAIEKCEGVSCLLARSSPYTSGIIIRQHGSFFREMLMSFSASLYSSPSFFFLSFWVNITSRRRKNKMVIVVNTEGRLAAART